MFEVTNTDSDIIFINKIINVFGGVGSRPTSLDINIDVTRVDRFFTTVTGNSNGEWTISEDSIYPGGDGPVTKKYKYHNGKWYELEENEEFKEIN